MMSHSDSSKDSNANNDQVSRDIDFGRLLVEARKAKNYTVEEVSEYLKIPVRTIVALEASDKEALPASTFTQGYIRAYAKFLETSEDTVLAVYNRAVPHDDSSDLKPRSNLPGEASSQSPLIKAITLLLIVAVITAIGVGGFQYYQKKADVMESAMDAKQQNFTGNSLNSPGSYPIAIKQKKRLLDAEPAQGRADISPADAGESEVQAATATATEEKLETGQADTSVDADRKDDSIEIIAENGSWVEVRDANKSRLLYNMLPVGGSRLLFGRAPFSVTMGNAKTTRVVVNDIAVDISDYIRSSNTASFKVSTQGQDVIFH